MPPSGREVAKIGTSQPIFDGGRESQDHISLPQPFATLPAASSEVALGRRHRRTVEDAGPYKENGVRCEPGAESWGGEKCGRQVAAPTLGQCGWVGIGGDRPVICPRDKMTPPQTGRGWCVFAFQGLAWDGILPGVKETTEPSSCPRLVVCQPLFR